ncbi:nicotinamide riboside transporter PnuC [Frateuria aurantia]
MTKLELVACVLNVWGVWLTARQRRACWPVSILAVALYAYLFHSWKLYSDMLLQGVYILLQFYGWLRWSRRQEISGSIRIQPMSHIELVLSMLAALAMATLLGSVMTHYTDASMPWLDASLTASSLVASAWTARQHLETWLLWIIVDTIYAAVFLYRHLPVTAGLYLLFVGLAAYGYATWRTRASRQEASRQSSEHATGNGLAGSA